MAISVNTITETINLNVDDICRVCLRNISNKENTCNIFTTNDPHSVCYMLMACTSIQIYENDGFPQNICGRCSARLRAAFEFKLECEESNKKLQRWHDHGEIILVKADHYPNLDDNIDRTIEIKSESRSEKTEIIEIANFNEYLSSPVEAHLPLEYLKEIPQLDHIVISTPQDVQTIPVSVTQMELGSTIEHIYDKSDQQGNNRSKNDQDKVNSSRKNQKNKLRVHQCDTCGKTFSRREYLTQHKRIHTGEKPYRCHICEKRFINSGHLSTHMRTHTGEKPHQCLQCPKAFSTRQELNKHTMVHNRERPYICKVCGKCYGSTSNLYSHLKHHTGEKNFTCEHCGKAFFTKQELKQHLVVHTGERAYLCEICNKRFSQIAHLKRHSKIHK